MPEPTHPPYESGALTTPRQLYRWLDVNAQNGRLNRTQTYIAVPPFNVATSWLGYSQIVAEYHYEAPNNFSLKVSALADVIPSGTNYTLCISYVNKDNSVVRYSLIRGAGDLFYAELTPYSGQLIKKNFRIEVWDTDSAAASETLTTLIYTSVKGSRDYRYDVDGPLVGNDPICEGQQSIGDTALTPDPIALLVWLDPQHTPQPTNLSWEERVSGQVFAGNTKTVTLFPPNILEFTGGQTFVNTTINGPSTVFLHHNWLSTLDSGGKLLVLVDTSVFKLERIGLIAFSDPKSIKLTITSSTVLQVDGLISSNDYIIQVSTSIATGTDLIVYNAGNLSIVGQVHSVVGYDIVGIQTVTIGDSGAVYNFTTRGILLYNTTNLIDLNRTLQYMSSLLSGANAMNLPLAWSPCAQPILNK